MVIIAVVTAAVAVDRLRSATFVGQKDGLPSQGDGEGACSLPIAYRLSPIAYASGTDLECERLTRKVEAQAQIIRSMERAGNSPFAVRRAVAGLRSEKELSKLSVCYLF